MVLVLWREGWLKPLSDFEIGSEICKLCEQRFENNDFVTSCEFCDIGIMHNICAEKHILGQHRDDLEKKISLQRERRLHDFQ